MADDKTELDLTLPQVVTKYKAAAEIINRALQFVISECKRKVKIVDICEKGDTYIREQTAKLYKTLEKGVAFPTCISVNNMVGHFSPLSSDETVLEEGDMIKIDMGCHIDGFITMVAHTHVLQEGPVTGRAADVIAAANTAAEVALRLVRPGSKNKEVRDAIQKVAAAYDCNIVDNVRNNQLKRFVVGVLDVPGLDTKVDDTEFEENKVYAIDIFTTTGDGKPKVLDRQQTTIYKRAVGKNYPLKGKASRVVLHEINRKFSSLPFTVRALNDDKSARLGLVECLNHDLLDKYPILYEKPGDLVAHVKFTVMLMPNGSDRITWHPPQDLRPLKGIDDDPEIKAWLALGIKTKKKRSGKKKKGKKDDKEGKSAEADPMDAANDVPSEE